MMVSSCQCSAVELLHHILAMGKAASQPAGRQLSSLCLDESLHRRMCRWVEFWIDISRCLQWRDKISNAGYNYSKYIRGMHRVRGGQCNKYNMFCFYGNETRCDTVPWKVKWNKYCILKHSAVCVWILAVIPFYLSAVFRRGCLGTSAFTTTVPDIGYKKNQMTKADVSMLCRVCLNALS